MRILLVGGGGREHAIAWKLKQDNPSLDLLAAPGNPGIGELARCVTIAATDIGRLVALAESEQVTFTIVGPEAPLAAGLTDRFRARGLPVFGPTQAAARIESSKRFAKELMLRAGVPTAAASGHTELASAQRAIRELGAPVVIKASGLAAGKGVVICESVEEAESVARDMLQGTAFGAAGRELVVEEFMRGEELSLFAITDGTNVVTMLPAQDHKRLLEDDRGPNTGGMGAYAPVSIGSPDLIAGVTDTILLPTLEAMRDAGCPFTGLLYAGLMLTEDGPRVVEFNCRFGDPETEAVVPLLRGSLIDPLGIVAEGGSLGGAGPLGWLAGSAVTTVVAAAGYPDAPRAGDTITLPGPQPDVLVFHCGTARGRAAADASDGRRDASGAELRTAGGRVLAVTGLGESFEIAHRRSSEAAAAVRFEGKQFRRDIGWRESARHARTA